MYIIFSSLAPVFLIMFAGFMVRKTSLLPVNTGLLLPAFAINVSIPCLIFHIMANTTMEQLSQGRWWVGSLALQVGALALFFLLEKYLRKQEAGPAMVSSLTVVFANVGFVGLPVIMSILPGNQAALTAAGLTVISSNLAAVVGQSVILDWSRKKAAGKQPQRVGTGQKLQAFLRRFVFGNPILVATLVGLALPLFHIPVWEPIDRACSALGYVSPTCMLFALGFTLSDSIGEALRGHAISVAHQIWLCLWRLAGFPLATLLVLVALDVDPLWISVTTIMMATGSAVMVASFAQVYRASEGEAALACSVTNVASLFSLAGFIWLLTRLGYLQLA